MAGIKTNVTAENAGGRIAGKRKTSLFPYNRRRGTYCSKDNSAIADKKLQLNRRAAKHSERIGVSAPRYKKRLANGDTGKKLLKETGNGKQRNKAFKKRG